MGNGHLGAEGFPWWTAADVAINYYPRRPGGIALSLYELRKGNG